MKALFITTLLSTMALAVGQGANAPAFSFFDTNSDGKITQAEFEDGQQRRQLEKAREGRMLRNKGKAPTFSEIDTDGDGVISKDEFRAHQLSRRGA